MYIGIDLGTSGVKLLLVSSDGKVLNKITKEYPIYYPYDGWCEQNPEDWWNATLKGVKELLKDYDSNLVKGISFGGQMHGLVILDNNDEIIRPAILWNDGRTKKQVDFLNNEIGKEKLVEYTGNFAFAGFTAPKILWLKENEYSNYLRINKILLPKDYLSFMFSGIYATDYSDASGTLLLDVKNKCWCKNMCEIVGVDENQLPMLYESYNVVGKIKEEVAIELGLSKNVKIIAGAGDNAAAAIGTGCVNNNSCNISLGTSGTVFISTDTYTCDSNLAIHSFNHANGKYHLMGCILTAASANKWWVEDILNSSFLKEQANIAKYIGNNDIYFLPYLMGERCPHNDVDARGAFIGLRANTTKEEMTLSILEGVCFALRDCLEIALDKGLKITNTTLCGGGAKSIIWANIMANILNLEINYVETEQGPSYGAAILAMVGCNEYSSVEEACSKIIKIIKIIKQDEIIVNKYKAKYNIYKELYPSLKNVNQKIGH